MPPLAPVTIAIAAPVMSAPCTSAPAISRALATAEPMPPEAPVTMAIAPESAVTSPPRCATEWSSRLDDSASAKCRHAGQAA